MTDKQKRFCDEYLVDLNATQAAIRAGYSEKTANRIASENLSKPDIQKYISDKKKELQERTDIQIDDVIDALKKIGFAPIDKSRIRPADQIKAIEAIVRMLGLDDPSAHDGNMLNKILDNIPGNI